MQQIVDPFRTFEKCTNAVMGPKKGRQATLCSSLSHTRKRANEETRTHALSMVEKSSSAESALEHLTSIVLHIQKLFGPLVYHEHGPVIIHML